MSRLQGATNKMLAAAEACYANDFGCSLRQLGLREMITESRTWNSGAFVCTRVFAFRNRLRLLVLS